MTVEIKVCSVFFTLCGSKSLSGYELASIFYSRLSQLALYFKGGHAGVCMYVPGYILFICQPQVIILTSPLFSRNLMSGLSARDGKPHFNEDVDTVRDFKGFVDMWGGGERGLHMALTLQKLLAAEQRGKKEMQWQKYVQCTSI
jgi:hypothetical protein